MRRRVRLERNEQLAAPRSARNSRLRRQAEAGQAGRGSRPLERRQVDVRGEVLPADGDERVGVDAVAVVRPQRGAASRRVEVGAGWP